MYICLGVAEFFLAWYPETGLLINSSLLTLGQLFSTQLRMKLQKREHKRKLLPRLTSCQILMKTTIFHQLKQTPTGIDHMNCIMTQTVAVLILKLV
jgi:hypothetical protein